MSTTIAIIGSGFGMYCLLPAFSNIENCKVVGICGKPSSRMNSFCEKFQVNHYTDWKEMIQKEKPDAVAIAVIPKYQFEIAKFAIQNGIAVFAEKPLSTDYQNSLELNNLAKKFDVPNMIDFEFPEIPEWVEAKCLLNDRVIGKISSIDVNWNFLSYDLSNNIKSWKTDIEQGGGAISLVLSHTLHYLEFFIGEITSVKSKISSSPKSVNGADTTIKMSILFKNDCKGNIDLDISDLDSQNHSIKFTGDNGTILLKNNSTSFVDNFQLILNKNNEDKEITAKKYLNKSNLMNEDDRVKIVKLLAKKFVDWCELGEPSRPNFSDGVRVQHLIEMVKNSNQ